MSRPADVAAWRRTERARLLALRRAMPEAERRAATCRINRLLAEGFPLLARLTVAFCWPHEGEVDVRVAVEGWVAGGARAALPVVAGRERPLAFRGWAPGVTMTPGPLGIPVPAGTPAVLPDAILLAMIGFDAAGHRLGWGGGYFDRTLASLVPRPVAIGVAFESGRLATIHPAPHDATMDFVVTEAGIGAVRAGRLEPVAPAMAARQCLAIATARGLGLERRP